MMTTDGKLVFPSPRVGDALRATPKARKAGEAGREVAMINNDRKFDNPNEGKSGVFKEFTLSLSQNNWFKILNPAVMVNPGAVRHALFDFDGTLSVLRQGWEPVMEAVMVEAICAGKTPSQELVAEVRNYIDISTGKLTILQMQWLADKVRSLGVEKNPAFRGGL